MSLAQPEKLVSNPAVSYGNSFNEQKYPNVSIVNPAYSEEGNLLKLYGELVQVLASMGVTWELIIVDDGSTDGTWREISALHQEDARVKGLRLSRNFGH